MDEMTGIITKRSSLLESQKKKFGENLKLSWFFDAWYEKGIMVGLGVLGLWKLWDLVLIWIG